MKQNKGELFKFFNCRCHFFLLLGCGIIAIYGSGCAGGMGSRIGRAALELDGSPNPTMYVDSHVWGSLYKGLTLDVVPIAAYGSLLDPTNLTAFGSFGNLQCELPLSFLPIPIVKNIRPYAGYGLGYLFAEKGLKSMFTEYPSILDGKGKATKFVAGGYLFCNSSLRIRLEYQRLKSTVTLKESVEGLGYFLERKLEPLSVDGRIFLVEVILGPSD